MLIAAHFLVGATIATHMPEAVPAALGALASHFVLDAIPHKDYIGKPILNRPNVIFALVDTAVALGLFFLLVEPRYYLYAFTISLVAVLPDLVTLPKFFWPKWEQLPIIKPLLRWHGTILQLQREPKFIKKDSRADWIWGLAPQVIIILVLFFHLGTIPYF
ncbi:MAG: hypothetical protein V1826_00585 [bacterium]